MIKLGTLKEGSDWTLSSVCVQNSTRLCAFLQHFEDRLAVTLETVFISCEEGVGGEEFLGDAHASGVALSASNFTHCPCASHLEIIFNVHLEATRHTAARRHRTWKMKLSISMRMSMRLTWRDRSFQLQTRWARTQRLSKRRDSAPTAPTGSKEAREHWRTDRASLKCSEKPRGQRLWRRGLGRSVQPGWRHVTTRNLTSNEARNKNTTGTDISHLLEMLLVIIAAYFFGMRDEGM